MLSSWKEVKSFRTNFNVTKQNVLELNSYPRPPGAAAGIVPHFKTRWINSRKLKELPSIPYAIAVTPPGDQEFPSWKLVESNKFGFSIKTRKVELNEYA
ncbi:MAG: hypothetical protein IIB83_00655, partial [Bacteroidetes bacterium]|nr:hypothetical protein [Bacteroidota bacterium]